MKEANKKLRYIGITLLILIGFYIILPYIFMGPPTSFFSVYDGDETSHIVTIEIIDSNNKSIFENTYELSPQEKITESKGLWLLFKMSLPLHKENYTIKTTLENNVSKETSMSLNPWTALFISIIDSSTFIDASQV
ncbi:hypothetical protein [Methanosarcina barkeri]|uniref:Uncharacterized protein n=1 Tax=Methanosarcina barkeri CM1 TaxID=796385 RepID=A0A0G3CKB4_METBA|nr:hypothetical protein [Methanosarcina barkeri]AKJ40353.1 hypothetical protein MCM1_3366 [Methanosarcina barkeri CM1]